jgi:hypothetical protein
MMARRDRRQALWRHLIWASGAWAILASPPAFASVFELFGAGPRSNAMAGALTAAAQGAEAVFHNPSLLANAPLAGAWVGGNTTRFDLRTTLDRPACQLSAESCRALHPAGWSTRAPAYPRDSEALAIGWNYPLRGSMQGKAGFGAALALPAGNLIRISGRDPQSPSYAQYEGMPDRLSFLFAFGVKPVPWWSLGLGVQVLAVLQAAVDLDIDPVNRDMNRAAIGIGLAPRARLTAGTAIHVSEALQFGLSYRQRLSLTYAIPSVAAFGTAADMAISLEHETLFSPDSVHAGVAWRPLDGPVLLSADLSVAMWSQMPDPSPQVALDVRGSALTALGVADTLDVGTDTPAVALRWRDTFSPALAAEWKASRHWTLRSGYRYKPSPAPYATGSHNYLDNDVHTLGLGARLSFGSLAPRLVEQLARAQKGPVEAPAPLFVDVGAQWLALPLRSVYKVDARDPVGALSHGGQVWHLGAVFGGAF